MIDFHTHPVLVRELVEADGELRRAVREVFGLRMSLMPLETFTLQMDVAA